MPVTKSGSFFGNAQQARMRDAMPKPAAIPAEAGQDDEETPQEITISKTPEGFHYTEPNNPEGADVASFDEVIAAAKECLGVEDEPGAEEEPEPAAPAADAGGAPPTRY